MAFCELPKRQNSKRRRLAKAAVFALFLLISCALIYNLQIIPVLLPLTRS